MPKKLVDLCNHCTEESSIEGKEIKNVAVLTIAFQLVYTGFYALQNLHSSLHDEDNLGLVSLSVMYGTGIISSMLSPTIIGMFGVKPVLITAFAAHSIYILANFYASFATMIPGAIFLGAFFGPAWTSQGVYVSACAYSYSKTASTSPFSVLSRFNGFFFAVMASTQILGNVFTSLVIRDGIGNNSEVLVFKYCGPKDCPAFENATEIEDAEQWVVDLTLSVFMALALLGLLLVFMALTPLPRSEWTEEIGPKKMTMAFVKLLYTTNMPLLVPFIIFTGMEHAFLMGSFTKSYVSCPIGIHMVGFVMSAYGITTPVFFLIFSKLVKITGRFLLITSSSILFLVLLLFLLHWEPTEDDEVVVFIIPVLWGIAESMQQAQANALIALMFPDQKEAAFANFHAWRSLGYCVTFLNVAYLCVSDKIIICIICLVVGSGLYVFVEIKAKVKEKDEMKGMPSNGGQDVIIDEEAEDGTPSTVSAVAKRAVSVTSFKSIQERLSFCHHELRDIIHDAENCWHRDSDGNIILCVDKVMSEEHLRDSKVTTLYHARPVSESPRTLHRQEMWNINNHRHQGASKSSPGLTRSQSESQFQTRRAANRHDRSNPPLRSSSANHRLTAGDPAHGINKKPSSSYLSERSNSNVPPRRVFSFHAHVNHSFESDEDYSNFIVNTINHDRAMLETNIDRIDNKKEVMHSGRSDMIKSGDSNDIRNGSRGGGGRHGLQKQLALDGDGKENIELTWASLSSSKSSSSPSAGEEEEVEHNVDDVKEKVNNKKSEKNGVSAPVDKTSLSSPETPQASIIEKMNKKLAKSKKEKGLNKNSQKFNDAFNQELVVKDTSSSSSSNATKVNSKNKSDSKKHKKSSSSKRTLLERRNGNTSSPLRIENGNSNFTNVGGGGVDNKKVDFYLNSPPLSPDVETQMQINSGFIPDSHNSSNGHHHQLNFRRHSIKTNAITEEEVDTPTPYVDDRGNNSDADSDGFVDIDDEEEAIRDIQDDFEIDIMPRIMLPGNEDTISIY